MIHYLLMVSFLDDKIPAETFIDPHSRTKLTDAMEEAATLIQEHDAKSVTIYALSSPTGTVKKELIITGDNDSATPTASLVSN